MPDEHGRLTEADNDLIQRWWSQHWKDDDPVICPVCKTTDWKTAGHLVNIPTHAPDANASNPPTYPHIIVICKFCAHSMFFNAVQIGIPVPPARQPTPGAAASELMGQGGILGLTRGFNKIEMAATGSSQGNRVRAVLEIDIRKRLSVLIADDKTGGLFVN